jgi:hypothetical protein
MKKFISILLVIFLLTGAGFASDYDDGYFRGKDDAKDHSTVGWGISGFLGGYAFGLIGVGVYTLISGGNIEAPEMRHKNTEYRRGYETGYQKDAKKKTKETTLTSSLLGWLVFIATYVPVI